MSSTIKKSLIIGVAVILALGAAVVAGRSGGGQININEKIQATDQTSYETPVNTNSQAILPNGGLVGKGDADTPPPSADTAPAEDAPATTTEEVTEGDGATPGEGDVNEGGETPSEEPTTN